MADAVMVQKDGRRETVTINEDNATVEVGAEAVSVVTVGIQGPAGPPGPIAEPAVSSAFGRTGDITAEPGDYSSNDITNDSGILSGTNVTEAMDAFASTVSDAMTGFNSQISTKADSSVLAAHLTNTSNPHAVTKAQVGLSNVDNTSDLSKPVSTATQAALDGKVSGPASSTNNAIVVWDGTNGRVAKNSIATIDGQGNLIIGKLLLIDAATGNPEFDFREAGTTRAKTYYDVDNNRLVFQNNENNNIDALFFADPAWFDLPVTMNSGVRTVPILRTANQSLSSTSPSFNPCDATSGNMTINLPSAAIGSGYQYTVKKIDASANTVTLKATTGQTIDGSNTVVLSARWKFITVVSDGTGTWLIVASNV